MILNPAHWQVFTLSLVLSIGFAPLCIAASLSTIGTSDVEAEAAKQKMAVEWQSCFRDLERSLPTLSPAQKKWLKNEVYDEMADGFITRRTMYAMDSAEYDISVARPHVEQTFSALDRLASGQFIARQQEIRLWAFVAYQFVDSQFWQAVRHLVGRDMLDKKICGVSWPNAYLENATLWAQQILQKAVIFNE